MIKHALNDNIVQVSIENVDFSYRIPVQKIGKTIDWRIGEKDQPNIVVAGVSVWAMRLFTKAVTDKRFVEEFQTIVQEYSPENSINWADTFVALNIQNEYNKLIANNAAAEEIISALKKKYKLD